VADDLVDRAVKRQDSDQNKSRSESVNSCRISLLWGEQRTCTRSWDTRGSRVDWGSSRA
jgi:hypothetical protein